MTEVRVARDAAEVDGALAVRREVFVHEQAVPLDEELDGRDDAATHLVVVEDGTVVATCRLLPDGDGLRLGRMAVAAMARRRGLAARLLEEAERVARAAGATQVVLDAQLTAMSVYDRAGYVVHGPVFLDAGIEHRAMTKVLAA